MCTPFSAYLENDFEVNKIHNAILGYPFILDVSQYSVSGDSIRTQEEEGIENNRQELPTDELMEAIRRFYLQDYFYLVFGIQLAKKMRLNYYGPQDLAANFFLWLEEKKQRINQEEVGEIPPREINQVAENRYTFEMTEPQEEFDSNEVFDFSANEEFNLFYEDMNSSKQFNLIGAENSLVRECREKISQYIEDEHLNIQEALPNDITKKYNTYKLTNAIEQESLPLVVATLPCLRVYASLHCIINNDTSNGYASEGEASTINNMCNRWKKDFVEASGPVSLPILHSYYKDYVLDSQIPDFSGDVSDSKIDRLLKIYIGAYKYELRFLNSLVPNDYRIELS